MKYLNKTEYGLWPNAIESRGGLFSQRKANYAPITRGYLALDNRNNVLKLRVHINWFTLPFLLFLFGIAFLFPNIIFKALFISFGAFIVMKLYGGERDQYLEIWEAVHRYSYHEQSAEDLGRTLS